MRMIVAAALAALLAPVPSLAETLPPRDECAADASFAAFRTGLQGIVKRKDAKALLAITAADVAWSLDADKPGRAGFVIEWSLDKPGKATIWPEFEAALALGCALDPGKASIPYMYGRLPESRDVFATTMPNRPRVNLRAGPSTNSAVVALLDWDILTIIDENDTSWTHVKTDDAKEGYVRVDFLRTALAYRAVFEKRGGKWIMTVFIAGD
ncbi:MAG: SH3 domain-containing protein [Sphingomonas sp.]